MAKVADNKQNMKIRTGIFCFLIGVFSFSGGLFGEEKVHTVRRGDTFYSIAQSLGVKVEDLMKHNGITDPARLQVGQRLQVPPLPGQAALPASVPANYRVVRGDTLYSIARKFSVTVAAIQEANNLTAAYVLRVGDNLKLPSGAKAPVSQAPAASTAAANAPSTAGSAAASAVSWPVAVRELAYMTGKLSGVVITGTRTEPVKSLTYGTVISAGPYRGFGRVVIVQVEGSYLYVYGGCENLSVKEGDKVGPGTELGYLGIDAVSNKPQLFFMVYRSNVPIDPAIAPRA